MLLQIIIITLVIPIFVPFRSISYHFWDKNFFSNKWQNQLFFQNFKPRTLKYIALTMTLHTYSTKVTLMQSLKNLHSVVTEICSRQNIKDTRLRKQGKTITQKPVGCGLKSIMISKLYVQRLYVAELEKVLQTDKEYGLRCYIHKIRCI